MKRGIRNAANRAASRHFLRSASTKAATMRAVRVHQPGDTSALKLDQIPIPTPQAGQVLIRNAYAGLNFIDVYHRTGLYPLPAYPATLGLDGGGSVVAVGPSSGSATAAEFQVGDTVAYFAPGSYAEFTAVDANKVVRVPEGLGLAPAVAAMVQGMTAHYLARSTCPLEKNDWCVVHAAAGGTGRLLLQMAKLLGAHVVATASTPAKLAAVRALGADVATTYERVVDEAKAATGGVGVRVAYDSVGAATWRSSLDCLRPRGLAVYYGNASGPVPPMDIAQLAAKGSLFVTRPRLFDYAASREDFLWRASEVLDWLRQGKISAAIDSEYSLLQVADAHTYLESRKTNGKVLFRIAPP